MSTVDTRIDSLSADKKRLLALLKNKKNSVPAGQPAFSMLSEQDKGKLPNNIVNAFPLGTVQLGMLYHMLQRRDASSPPDYHNVASFKLRLDHCFNLHVFQESVNMVVANEPGLRTSFDMTNYSEPLQIVHEEASLKVNYMDCRHLSDDEQNTELDVFIQYENFNVIHVNAAPLMRLMVHHLQDNVISLSLTEPHSIADGWSTHLTLIDFFEAYYAKIENKPFTLKKANTDYSEFIFEERKTLNSVQTKAFWQSKLADCVLTELPKFMPSKTASRTAIDAHKEPFLVPREVMAGLHRLAERAKVPIKAVLLAAHFKFLSVFTGQNTVTSGLNFNGRLETEDGIKVRGLFLNILPVTVTLDDCNWIELSQKSHKAELEVLPHRRYPLGALQSQYGNKHLFNTALSFLHFHSLSNSEIVRDGRIEHLSTIDHSKTNFDFNAVFSLNPEDKNELFYIGDANLDVHSSEQVSQFLRCYKLILEEMAFNHEHLHNQSELIPLEDKYLLTQVFSSSWQVDSSSSSVVDLFEKQVKATPHAKALTTPSGNLLTYEELNARANQVARTIQQYTGQSQQNIVIYYERSLDMVIAILGVLKSGNTYIPLDIASPTARVDFIIEASNAKLLLSNSQHEFKQVNQLSVAECTNSSKSAENLGLYPSSQEIAYVLYTSGSTGKPKGVQVHHGGLTNYLCWAMRSYLSSAQDRLPLFTSVAFDLTVTTLFTPLIMGASIVIYPEQEPVSLLQDIVRDNLVNVIKLTPAHLALLSQLDITNWNAERMVVGGEALQSDLCHAITAAMRNNVSIYNEYGPTETVVGCSMFQFNSELPRGISVPIGRPADNTQLYVLDRGLHLLPNGVKGELYVAGDGVSLGYLGEPEKTAEVFLDNPFGEGKIYKTGDMVRWMPCGNLDYIGRIDNQIKVRGYRIEPSEIELKLIGLEAIANALVTTDGEGNDKQLVAYIEPLANGKVAQNDLIEQCKDAIRKGLPNYMMPAAFVLIEQWPLTANGKVDRAALPAPDYGIQNLDSTATFVAPRTPLEHQLAVIWQEILGVDRVGIHNSFFELGGHSIMALRLISMIQDKLKVALETNLFFASSTIAQLAKHINESNPAEVEALPKVTEDLQSRYEVFPLTDVQQAYLLGRSSAFSLGNVSTQVYIEANLRNLDVGKLSRAWNRLLKRHEMLRAVFTQDGTQRILRDVPDYVINSNDFSGLDEIEKTRRLQAICDEMSHKLISVDEWPLFEIRVSQFEREKFRLHFSMDALLADARSIDIIIAEMNALYDDESKVLEPLHLSFRDYVLTEQTIKSSIRYKQAKEYWLSRVDDLPVAPDLPLRIDPAEVKSPYFKRRSMKLPKKQWGQLKAQAQNEGVSPTVLLLTLFSMTIRHWSKSEQFTLNLTLFNRLPLHDQVSDIIGDFTSLTLLAIDFNQSLTVAENSKRVQRQLWQDLEHRYFSGTEVLRELNRRSGNVQAVGMPIVFSSTLGMDNQVEQTSDTAVEDAFSITQTSQVWLDHQLSEQNGELVLTWDAIDELFPDAMLDTMFEAYGGIIRDVAENVDRIHESACLPVPELQKQLRVEVNNTACQRPDEGSGMSLLHGGFEGSVMRFPDKIALVSGSIHLTYLQLNTLANLVAIELTGHEVRNNEPVAVVMEKGWEQVVAVFAILKNGAAYLPIDANLPKERIKQIIEQSKARIAICQDKFIDELQTLDGVEIVKISSQILEHKDETISTKQQPVKNTDLAYVIFTSGSTGKPKGVMIDHRGAVNTIMDINTRFGVTDKDAVLGVSSLSFDLSVYDIFGILGTGGKLVLPSAAADKDPQHWLSLVAQENVTVWNTVPALAQLLFEESAKHQFIPTSQLSIVMMSGDWIPLDLPELILQGSPHCKLFSLGGATEASIWSIYYPIKNVESHWTSIPYGKPMENQTFYVLDKYLHERPVWAIGDLYIGGIGVALGYWNDDERTNASFITHPETKERLYKTGDLGRYLPCGNIEFLGREDSQVKINGYRVELGDIEAQLTTFEQVKACIVTTYGDKKHNRRIGAYVVVNEGQLDESACKTYLKQRLPHYMIPSVIMSLKALPLTANGKVDRKSLPQIGEQELVTVRFEAPATKAQLLLTKACAQLLEIDEKSISMSANFFELGGHSLMAIRLINLLREKAGADVSMQSIFTATTLKELAQIIEDSGNLGKDVMAIAPYSRDSELMPVSFAQQRLLFLDKMNNGIPEYNLVMPFKVHGPINLDIMHQAFTAVIERHEVLRTVYIDMDGVSYQKVNSIHDVNFEIQVIELSGFDSQTTKQLVERAIIEDAQKPFNLARDLMLRVHYLNVGNDNGVLLFNMSHIASDGWSLNILTNEFVSIYRAIIDGQQSPLKDLIIQYVDFAHWQRNYYEQALLGKQIDYWVSQLDNIPVVHSLPLSAPREAFRISKGAIHKNYVGLEVARKLEKVAKEFQLTPFMLMHGALSLVLAKHSNQSDIVLGTPVANRLGTQLDNMIGFFANTIVMRVNTDQNTIGKYFAHVKQVNIDAQENQDIPFEKLVDALSVPRTTLHSPVFQIMLTVNGNFNDPAPANNYRLGDVVIEPIESVVASAKFDLHAHIEIDITGIQIQWTYDANIFSEQYVSILNDSLCRVFESIVQHSSATTLRSLPILSETQLRVVLQEFNQTQRAYPKNKTVVTLFELQVEQTPDLPAICMTDGRALSYRELNSKANKVASFIADQGLQRGSNIGVYHRRSVDMVIAILAILKAGHSYVPIDAALPAERVADILASANVQLLCSDVVDSIGGTRLLDVAACQNSNVAEQNLAIDLHPSDIAYVLYTSGSTGKPKGVQVHHQGLTNYLCWAQRMYLKPGDVMPLFTSIGFDLTVTALFTPLITGASILVYPDQEPVSLLEKIVSDNRSTVLKCTPAHLSLLSELSLNSWQVERMIVGGESLKSDVCHRIITAKSGELRIFNEYGPTETVVGCSVFEFRKDLPHDTIVPIGKAADNVQLYVLDARLEPVAIGVTGELYVGGDGVSLGYLGDEQRTRDVFLANPYGQGLLYKTGDLARWLPCGNLECLGRVDEQIKIRGHRIEPGEIEQHLVSIDFVSNAVVVALQGSASSQLVAYIGLPKNYLYDANEVVEKIKTRLRQKLPSYMIPSLFIVVDEWPLTPNGKIDKRALPAPHTHLLSAYVAPITETQKLLAKIWADLLQTDPEHISATANFFELGGNSIQISRLNNAIQKKFDSVSLDIAKLFGMPSLQQQALEIDYLKSLNGVEVLDGNMEEEVW